MKNTVIKAKHYDEVVKKLMKLPEIQDMALGIKDVPRSDLTHDDGGPRFEFMMASNQEFRNRKPDCKLSLHIGAVAEALLKVLGDKTK